MSLLDRFASTQIGAALLAMSPARRFIAVGGALTTIVLLVAVAWWSSRPNMVVLASKIDYAEVSRITEALAEAGIKVAVTSAGTEVRVSEKEFAKARIALAQADIAPQGGNQPGLELFQSPGWTWTDFSEKVNYRRAIEGELSRSIQRLKGVRSAVVHVTMPETHPFRRSQENASASVSLELEAGASLSHEAIQGIKYLVASSVERLSSDDVSVLDTQGRVLSAPAPDGPLALADRRLDYRRSLERELADKVRLLLADVVGPGNVRVEVSADLDFDRVVRRSEAYDAAGQVILSEQKSEVGATEPPAPPMGGGSSSTTTNYQNPVAIESVEKAVGTVSRLSVAVLLNETALSRSAQDSSSTLANAAIVDLDQITEIVRGAVGFNQSRGDQVVVRTAPFGDGPIVAVGGTDWLGLLTDNLRLLGGLVGLILLFLFGRRILGMFRAPAPVAEPAYVPGLAVEAEAGESVEPEFALPEPEVSQEHKDYMATLQEAMARGRKKPDAAARVVRAWIKGE